MKKKWSLILCAALLLSVIATFYPRSYGNVSAVLRTVGDSDVYTREDIEAAMDIAQAHFQKNFAGCKLLALSYDADWWAQDTWDFGTDQVLVLTSSFYVPPKGADGCWNPNSLYTGWQWVLARNDGEAWTLKTSGYG